MSDTPVAERLQVKRGRTLAVIDAPAEVDAAIGAPRRAVAEADVVLLFVRDRSAVAAGVPRLLAEAAAGAIVWIAYPKLTSALAGDLNRDVLHAAMPGFGLEGVSQIAIDDTWSALRVKRVISGA